MDLLKRNYWWVWLIIALIANGIGPIIIAVELKIFDRNAWYAKWYYWVIGFVLVIFPAMIMLTIFLIQINCKVCEKLSVPLKEIYMSPYIWILGIIIPIFGWLFLVLMNMYIGYAYIVMLAKGEGEKYIT